MYVLRFVKYPSGDLPDPRGSNANAPVSSWHLTPVRRGELAQERIQSNPIQPPFPTPHLPPHPHPPAHHRPEIPLPRQVQAHHASPCKAIESPLTPFVRQRDQTARAEKLLDNLPSRRCLAGQGRVAPCSTVLLLRFGARWRMAWMEGATPQLS